MYIAAFGGKHWVLFWYALITAIFLASILEALQPWLLGIWAGQYEKHPMEEVKVVL